MDAALSVVILERSEGPAFSAPTPTAEGHGYRAARDRFSFQISETKAEKAGLSLRSR
jgi:hypothetical protein